MPTSTHSRGDLDLSKIDWRRFDETTDAEIDRQIADDPDTAPVFTTEEITSASRRIAADQIEDVRALRERLGLSQASFAARFGFSVETIRQYEQNKRVPSGPIRTLLQVIASEPDAVTRALARRASSVTPKA
jgi:putative transcriptional regulator